MPHQSTPSVRPAPRSLFGLALILSLALAGALASSASAVSLSPESGAFELQSSGAAFAKVSTKSELENVTCSQVVGNGQFTTGTSGTAQLSFTGCLNGGVKCTSPGQTAGTIVTSPLTATLDYTYPETGTFGVGLKPQTKGAAFAEFSCTYLGQVKWKGGIILRVTNPGINGTPSTVVSFSVDSTSQTSQDYIWLAKDAKEFLEKKYENVFLYGLSQERLGASKNMGLQFTGDTYWAGGKTYTFLP